MFKLTYTFNNASENCFAEFDPMGDFGGNNCLFRRRIDI